MKRRNTSHICAGRSLFKQHFSHRAQMTETTMFSCCQAPHIMCTPPDQSNTECAPTLFIFISSWLCLSRVSDYSQASALGLLILEYIINNLHVISFVLIIFVWQNVSLHGECWGYLPHLETQGTPFRVCYVALSINCHESGRTLNEGKVNVCVCVKLGVKMGVLHVLIGVLIAAGKRIGSVSLFSNAGDLMYLTCHLQMPCRGGASTAPLLTRYSCSLCGVSCADVLQRAVKLTASTDAGVSQSK